MVAACMCCSENSRVNDKLSQQEVNKTPRLSFVNCDPSVSL
jgi:hypothetical protein